MKTLLPSKKSNVQLGNEKKISAEKDYLFPSLKIGIVIPAYNEELNIGATLEQIPVDISDKLKIIVVDDGSIDNTSDIALNYDITLLKHPKNRGNGAATKTGLDYCRERNLDLVVILDADGQHDPKYISDFVKPILEDGTDFVIGNRFKYYYNMQPKRKVCSKLMTAFYLIFLRKKVADPTNGYRALSSKLLQELDFESEYSLTQEMLYKVIPYYRYKEIPIKVNPRTQGHSFINIRNYLRKIILLFLKFYIFPKVKKITHMILSDDFRNRVKTYYLKT